MGSTHIAKQNGDDDYVFCGFSVVSGGCDWTIMKKNYHVNDNGKRR